MSLLQIRDVPDDVIQIYKLRAQTAGQSLQQYMRDKVIRDAGRESMADLMSRVERELSGSTVTHEDVLEAIAEARRIEGGDEADL